MAVHPGFFERDEVLAEKQQLYPEGAWLCEADGTAVRLSPQPSLARDGTCRRSTRSLGQCRRCGTYYLHDLALLPEARGIGAAGDIVGIALAKAAMRGLPHREPRRRQRLAAVLAAAGL